MWNKLKQTFSHYTFFWKNMNPFAICRSLGVQTFLWKHKSSSLLLGHKNVENKEKKSRFQKYFVSQTIGNSVKTICFQINVSYLILPFPLDFAEIYLGHNFRWWKVRGGGALKVPLDVDLHDKFKCGEWVRCTYWTQTKTHLCINRKSNTWKKKYCTHLTNNS